MKAGKAFASAAEVMMAAQARAMCTCRRRSRWSRITEPVGDDGGDRHPHRAGRDHAGPGDLQHGHPRELGFINRIMDRKGLKALIAQCYRELRSGRHHLVDGIKTLGFHYATVAGITIGIDDIRVPDEGKAAGGAMRG